MSADASVKSAHSRSKLKELAAELLERKERGAGEPFCQAVKPCAAGS